MGLDFSISISRVVELLGLYRDPRSHPQATSYYVQCPFCEDKKWHMNINEAKNSFRCVLCGASGGVLALYGPVAHGTKVESGENGNSKKLFAQLCADLKLESPRAVATAKRAEQPLQIQRAEDKVVHATYRELLSLPEFVLSSPHRNNLLERGLKDEVIDRNKYRSFLLEDVVDALVSPETVKWYNKNIRAAKRELPILRYFADKRIMAGLVLAKRLERKGCVFEGVPGFFKLGGYWCFRLEDGMYIPTRNMTGQIVALQVRKDDGDIRYKTISSKDLPEGVSVNISRTHFPIHNASLDSKPTVVLTEGPLKADVALELMEEDSIMLMAIHGVNNTAELGNIFDILHEAGITKIVNALDMDKITNPNVLRASKAIRALAKEHGLSMTYRFWGIGFAKLKEEELEKKCQANSIEVPKAGNPYWRIANMTAHLTQAGVDIEHGWESRSKGLDDFLLYGDS